MKRRDLLSASLLALCLASGRITALRADDATGDTILTKAERRLITGYYQQQYDKWDKEYSAGHKSNGLPPGVAKRGILPPAIYQHLARNETLPPGVAAMALPDDLSTQLPPRPASQKLVIVEDKVLLLQAATNLILDVLGVTAVDYIATN